MERVSSWRFRAQRNGNADGLYRSEPLHTLRVIHVGHMGGVQPKQRIYYRVGCMLSGHWSNVTIFTAPPSGNDAVTMAVFGDLGHVNGRSISLLSAEVDAGSVHMVCHNGDWAYNLDTDEGVLGDLFMNDIMPMSSRIPYMGNIGNHENQLNQSHFINRLRLWDEWGVASGAGSQNLWFSWSYMSGGARVHMIALDSEVYFLSYLQEQQVEQFKWLQRDLQACDKADWCIAYVHRPLYCSNTYNGHNSTCTVDTLPIREGQYGLEQLLHKYHVDILLAAHQHSYERTYPLYLNQGELYQSNHTYINPKATVYLTSGSAGCQEDLDPISNQQSNDWSVMRSDTYGYGHLTVHNKTHLYWDQLLDEGRQPSDTLWIIKESRQTQTKVSSI